MRWKNFAFYGFDKETYDSVKDLRDQTNRRHTEIIATLFLFMMIALSVLSVLSVITYAHRAMYIEFAIASAVFTVVLLAAKNFTTRHTTLFMYLLIAIMLFFSIESSISDTFQVGIIFPVFTAMICVSFFDNMPRFSLVMAAFWILFLVYSYLRKPPSIACGEFWDFFCGYPRENHRRY